ncbi:MAG: hypothetical protein ACRCW2_10330 [Cellulosilyticaceae bacterium]
MATTSDLILMADRLIDHTDFLNLNCTCLLPSPPCSDTIVLITLEEGASLDKTFCLSNGTALLGSLYYLGVTVGWVIKVLEHSVSYCLALRFCEDAASIVDAVYDLLKLQFPNAKKNFLSQITLHPTCSRGIEGTTFLPTANHNTPSILPNLFSLFKGKHYTLFFLMTPIDACTYLKQKKQFLVLYEQLFSLREMTHSCTDNNSQSNTKGTSSSESLTITYTDSHNESSSINSSTSEVSSCNLNFSPKLTDRASVAQSSSSSSTSNTSNNTTDATSHVCTEQKVCSSSTSDSDACSSSKSHTYGSRDFNREIDLHLQKIDSLLALFEVNLTLPIFQFAMYVIGNSIGDALLIQSTYNQLIQPSAPTLKSFYVNHWSTPPSCVETIQCYLQTLRHPCFCQPQTKTPISATLTCTNYQLNQLIFACSTPNSST